MNTKHIHWQYRSGTQTLSLQPTAIEHIARNGTRIAIINIQSCVRYQALTHTVRIGGTYLSGNDFFFVFCLCSSTGVATVHCKHKTGEEKSFTCCIFAVCLCVPCNGICVWDIQSCTKRRCERKKERTTDWVSESGREQERERVAAKKKQNLRWSEWERYRKILAAHRLRIGAISKTVWLSEYTVSMIFERIDRREKKIHFIYFCCVLLCLSIPCTERKSKNTYYYYCCHTHTHTFLSEKVKRKFCHSKPNRRKVRKNEKITTVCTVCSLFRCVAFETKSNLIFYTNFVIVLQTQKFVY